MKDNSSKQQSQANPKWQGITSLILGIISILADFNIIIVYSRVLNDLLGGKWYPDIIDPILTVSLFGGWIFAMVGFIFGIIGLKCTKKKLAIAGIALSVIGFIAYVFLWAMAVRIGTG